jgi:hypothetical protein
MSWQDDFGYLNAALQQNYVGSRPRQLYARPFRPSRGSGYSAWDVSPASAPNWLDFSTGQISGAAPTSSGSASGRGAAFGASAPAAAPEKFNVNLGYSGAAPRAPRNTQGDLLGSIGEAAGGVLNAINPFNAIPWLMERVDVASGALADEIGKAAPGNPIAGFAQGAIKAIDTPFHVFGEAVKVAGDAISPVLEALPNWYRDTQLNDRAKLYSAIVHGQVLDPWTSATLSGNLLPFSSRGARDINNEYMAYHKELVDSMDPAIRADAQKRISILLDSFDLPPSVKAQIQRNPTADVKKLLDDAPEGRQFSYQGGVSGFVSNLGYPLLFYLAEAKGLGTAANKARGSVPA